MDLSAVAFLVLAAEADGSFLDFVIGLAGANVVLEAAWRDGETGEFVFASAMRFLVGAADLLVELLALATTFFGAAFVAAFAGDLFADGLALASMGFGAGLAGPFLVAAGGADFTAAFGAATFAVGLGAGFFGVDLAADFFVVDAFASGFLFAAATGFFTALAACDGFLATAAGLRLTSALLTVFAFCFTPAPEFLI